jgi:hypothetical protein
MANSTSRASLLEWLCFQLFNRNAPATAAGQSYRCSLREFRTVEMRMSDGREIQRGFQRAALDWSSGHFTLGGFAREISDRQRTNLREVVLRALRILEENLVSAGIGFIFISGAVN